MVPKKLKRAMLYNSTKYHALVNPAGIATHIGTPETCLKGFYYMRWGDDAKEPDWLDLASAETLLKPAGWQIIPARVAVFTPDVDAELAIKESA